MNHYKNSLSHNKLVLTQNLLDTSAICSIPQKQIKRTCEQIRRRTHMPSMPLHQEALVLTWKPSDSDFGYNSDKLGIVPHQQCKTTEQ